MSPVTTALEDRIVALLMAATNRVLPMSEIEQQLAQTPDGPVDTFVVRRAVWRLIDQGRADFTPRWDVKAIGA